MNYSPESQSLLPQANHAQVVEERFLQALIMLVAVETGLQILVQDREKFRQIISSRMKLLTLPDPEKYQRLLDVHFVSSVPVKRHACARGHPVPRALTSWIPAFAGMTQGRRNWQCIYEMDI